MDTTAALSTPAVTPVRQRKKSAAQVISSAIPVTFRKMRFKFDAVPAKKYWHDNNPFISFFWSAMSTAFPEGERFFMDSGRYFKDDIKDAGLKLQIEEFIRQEAHHTWQHKKLNALMAGHGFDMERYDHWFGTWLGWARKGLNEKQQLAVSMALEHFTANFANQYLSNETLTKGADPEVKALWAWHAVEEIEHKGVLYDLYEEIGGDYFTRVVVLAPAWLMLIGITLVAQADMLAKDRKLLDVGNNLRGIWYLLGYRGLVTSMLPQFVRYFVPGFHPWSVNDRELIDRWYDANVKYIVGLKTISA